MGWFRKVMFWFLRNIVKARGLRFVQLGLLVRAHLLKPSPILAHEQNLSIWFSWGCIKFMLEDITAKSSAYIAEFIFVFEVLNV